MACHVTARSVGIRPGVEKQAQDAYVQEIVRCGLERNIMRTMTPNQPLKMVYLLYFDILTDLNELIKQQATPQELFWFFRRDCRRYRAL